MEKKKKTLTEREEKKRQRQGSWSDKLNTKYTAQVSSNLKEIEFPSVFRCVITIGAIVKAKKLAVNNSAIITLKESDKRA